MDFQKYNVKEKKQKEKIKKKIKRNLKSHKNYFKNSSNHIKTIYDVCLRKIVFFFLKSNSRL